jgi:hypothetical protein
MVKELKAHRTCPGAAPLDAARRCCCFFLASRGCRLRRATLGSDGGGTYGHTKQRGKTHKFAAGDFTLPQRALHIPDGRMNSLLWYRHYFSSFGFE